MISSASIEVSISFSLILELTELTNLKPECTLNYIRFTDKPGQHIVFKHHRYMMNIELIK
jgi:hypothetical protein